MNETIHATAVAIERAGAWRAVLLAGPSGAGKSDLALRLIDRGARLVADDYTDLHGNRGVLVARPPATIAGKLEVRGLGIADLPHLAESSVALLVRLDSAVPRLPDEPLPTVALAGIVVPVLALDPFHASAAIKVEMALASLGRPA